MSAMEDCDLGLSVMGLPGSGHELRKRSSAQWTQISICVLFSARETVAENVGESASKPDSDVIGEAPIP